MYLILCGVRGPPPFFQGGYPTIMIRSGSRPVALGEDQEISPRVSHRGLLKEAGPREKVSGLSTTTYNPYRTIVSSIENIKVPPWKVTIKPTVFGGPAAMPRPPAAGRSSSTGSDWCLSWCTVRRMQRTHTSELPGPLSSCRCFSVQQHRPSFHASRCAHCRNNIQ